MPISSRNAIKNFTGRPLENSRGRPVEFTGRPVKSTGRPLEFSRGRPLEQKIWPDMSLKSHERKCNSGASKSMYIIKLEKYASWHKKISDLNSTQ